MVIFYKKSLAQMITKQSSSKKYDILWLRMNSSEEDNIFGFFYAPGITTKKNVGKIFGMS